MGPQSVIVGGGGNIGQLYTRAAGRASGVVEYVPEGGAWAEIKAGADKKATAGSGSRTTTAFERKFCANVELEEVLVCGGGQTSSFGGCLLRLQDPVLEGAARRRRPEVV